MSQRYALPSEWVAAIRDDAEADYSEVALQRAGIQHKITSPKKIRVHIGRVYPGTIPPPKGIRADGVEYLKHPPTCQACGTRITHGDRAVRYRYHRTRPSLGRIRYIHCTCPEESECQAQNPAP